MGLVTHEDDRSPLFGPETPKPPLRTVGISLGLWGIGAHGALLGAEEGAPIYPMSFKALDSEAAGCLLQDLTTNPYVCIYMYIYIYTQYRCPAKKMEGRYSAHALKSRSFAKDASPRPKEPPTTIPGPSELSLFMLLDFWTL